MPDDDLTSRAKQLAKDLLDEMDKPKSPEREAYEARKDLEDRERLERLYIATGQYPPDQLFSKLLEIMAVEIEKLDPPAGPFEPIELAYKFKGRKGVLRFGSSPNKPARRYIELSLDSESGLSTSAAILDTGTNAEIVQYLRKPEQVVEMIATAEDCIVSLARNNLA